MTHIALYLRVSHDRDGDTLAVSRQETECRELIGKDGRTEPIETYTDNDISAAGRKRRPEYERMLRDIRAGRVAAVYAWKSDRVIRKMEDLTDFMAACGSSGGEDARVPLRTVASGHYDFHTPSGKMIAEILTSVAGYEVGQTIQRIKAKTRQRRESGTYYLASTKGGNWCHFVYRQNGDGTLSVRPDAAEQYLSEVKRLLAAGPGARLLASFARERNEKGIKPGNTSRGNGLWVSDAVGASLLSAAPAAVNETAERRPGGRPDYDKRVKVADGNWPAVTDYDTVLAVRRVLLHPGRPKYYGREPAHLLTGLLECGACGQRAFFWHKASGKLPARYVCMAKKRKPGGPATSYHLTHRADQLDAEVTKLVMAMIGVPGLVGAFTRPGVDVDALRAERRKLAEQREDAAEAFEAGHVRADAWGKADTRLAERIDALTERISAALHTSPLEPFATGDDPAAVWERTTIAERRAAARALIDHVTIYPRAQRGRPAGIPAGAPWPFEPDRVLVTLRPRAWDHVPPEIRALVSSGIASYVRHGKRATGPIGPWQPDAQQAEDLAAAIQPALLRRIAPREEDST